MSQYRLIIIVRVVLELARGRRLRPAVELRDLDRLGDRHLGARVRPESAFASGSKVAAAPARNSGILARHALIAALHVLSRCGPGAAVAHRLIGNPHGLARLPQVPGRRQLRQEGLLLAFAPAVVTGAFQLTGGDGEILPGTGEGLTIRRMVVEGPQ